MRIRIEMSIQCSQCQGTVAFIRTTFIPEQLDVVEKDADAYFEGLGWIKLPSGRWVCDQHNSRQVKEAA